MQRHLSGLTAEEFWLRYQRYPYVLAKLVTYGLVAVGIYLVLHSIQSVLIPVFIALFLGYLLDPAVDWFEERGFSRTVGIVLFLGIGGVFLTLFIVFLSPTVEKLITQITAGIPKLADLVQNQILPWYENRARPWLHETLGIELTGADGVVSSVGDTLKVQLPSLLQRVTSTLGDVWIRTGAIVASVLNIVLVPVLTFFFLRDFDVMRLAAVDFLPSHNRAWWLERISQMNVVVGAWFRGQVEVALILSVLYALGLGFVFGISGIGLGSGVAIGLLSGMLNIIPYFGFLIGIVLSILLAVLDWHGVGPLIGVLIVFAVVQGLEGYLITPRVVGEKVGLPPVVVIITLLIGGQVLGLLGVLLALPIAGAFRVFLPDLIAWYRRSDLYTGEIPQVEPVAPAVTPPPAVLPPPEPKVETT